MPRAAARTARPADTGASPSRRTGAAATRSRATTGADPTSAPGRPGGTAPEAGATAGSSKAGAPKAAGATTRAPKAGATASVTTRGTKAGAKAGATTRATGGVTARAKAGAAVGEPRRARASTARASAAEERLGTYRAKRRFDVTSEPRGGRPPAADGHRFVVQRHRASHLHYDLRLEAAGVLLSWAVPKGPTLDPDARRLAMHVEDHPLEYFDFEGVIPAGEYGGGDVIVWDWGTWSLAEDRRHRDPLAAVEAGELHFDLAGEKLAGRFALVRRGPRGRREQWMLVHKRDEAAVPGWDAEDHPRSVKSGRTNDDVAAAPSATWTGSATWVGPDADELAALDAIPRTGTWDVAGRHLKLTNLDKVLFPAGRGAPAYTKRDLVRHYATFAPAILPYTAGRPINLHRYPEGVAKPGFWHKSTPEHAPEWLTRWDHPHATGDEARTYSVLDEPAALVWAANFGAVELHPWTSTAAAPYQPTWAMIDIDPGESSDFQDVLVLARLHRTALEHLGVEACPKVTGQRGVQVWIPVADGTSFEQTRAWVEQLSRVIGATVPDMVSWDWEVKRRRGRIRLDYTQNAINKTLVAPFSVRPKPGAPVSVPIHWDELDDPDLRPDRWTIADVAERWRTCGDPLAPLVGRQQRLPPLT